MSHWTYVHKGALFVGVLASWLRQHRDIRLNAPRGQQEALQEQTNEYTTFIRKLADLTLSQDPISQLHVLQEPLASEHPEIRQLVHGKWRAFYAVSVEDKLCYGVLVFREGSKKLPGQLLNQAITQLKNEANDDDAA